MSSSDDLLIGALEISSGGDISLSGGGTVTGLPTTPVGSTDAASKAYVDAIAGGVDPKASVRYATAAALAAYTATGSGVGKYLEADANGALSVDGQTPSVDDRILVKDENSGGADVDHGIYVVTTVGDAGTPWRLTRATDFDEDAEVTSGAHCWVEEGDTLASTAWVVVTADPITVDTTAIDWSQYAGEGLYTGGNGIAISGSREITVDLSATSGLEFDTGKLQVKDYYGITVDANGVSVDGYAGITVDANGVSVDAGDGLIANAGGDLDVELSATSGLEFSTGQLQVKVDPAGAIDRLAAGLHVRTDDTTIQINGSNELEVLAASTANRLEAERTAAEALALGDAIEFGTTADRIRECQASVGARVDCCGVVEEAGGIGSGSTGTVVHSGIAVGVISGATVGQRFYVGRTGGIVQGVSSLIAGDHVVFVGQAVNANDLYVQPQYITQI